MLAGNSKILQKVIFLLLFFAFETTCSFAQTNGSQNAVTYDFSFEFYDGVYISFHAFRNNKPIPFERFVSPENDENFTKKLAKTDIISFYDENGLLNEMPRKNIWGYAKNGKPYIYFLGKFNLIPYIGTISHFMSTELVTHYSSGGGMMMYNTMYSPINQTYTTEELVHFFLDTRTGTIQNFSSKTLLELIKDDQELYNEYQKLSKRKRSKLSMEFVQKYNQRHPITFQQ